MKPADRYASIALDDNRLNQVAVAMMRRWGAPPSVKTRGGGQAFREGRKDRNERTGRGYKYRGE